VAGDDADGVAEGAGGGEGDLAFEGPAVGGALAMLLEGGQLDLGELVGVVDPDTPGQAAAARRFQSASSREAAKSSPARRREVAAAGR
jgi:hypothetical protein